jgi:hypothetical protein
VEESEYACTTGKAGKVLYGAVALDVLPRVGSDVLATKGLVAVTRTEAARGRGAHCDLELQIREGDEPRGGRGH